MPIGPHWFIDPNQLPSIDKLQRRDLSKTRTATHPSDPDLLRPESEFDDEFDYATAPTHVSTTDPETEDEMSLSDAMNIDPEEFSTTLGSVEGQQTQLVPYEAPASQDTVMVGSYEGGPTTYQVPPAVKTMFEWMSRAEMAYRGMEKRARDMGVDLNAQFALISQAQTRLHDHELELRRQCAAKEWQDAKLQQMHVDLVSFTKQIHFTLSDDASQLKMAAELQKRRLDSHEKAIQYVHDETQAQLSKAQTALSKIEGRVESLRNAGADIAGAQDRQYQARFGTIEGSLAEMKTLLERALGKKKRKASESTSDGSRLPLPMATGPLPLVEAEMAPSDPPSVGPATPRQRRPSRHVRQPSSTGLTEAIGELGVGGNISMHADRPPRIEEVEEGDGGSPPPLDQTPGDHAGDGGDGGRPPNRPTITGDPGDGSDSSSSSDSDADGDDRASDRQADQTGNGPVREPRRLTIAEGLNAQRQRLADGSRRNRGPPAGNPGDSDPSDSEGGSGRPRNRRQRSLRGDGSQPHGQPSLLITRPTLPNPEKFKGDSAHFEVWWEVVENWLSYHSHELFTDQDKIVMISGLLRDEAQRWSIARRQHYRQQGVADSWEEFVRDMKRHFSNPHAAYDAEREMRELSYDGNIHDFVVKLQSLNLKVQLHGPAFRNLVETALPAKILKQLGTFPPAEDDAHFLEMVVTAGRTIELLDRKIHRVKGKGGDGAGKAKHSSAGNQQQRAVAVAGSSSSGGQGKASGRNPNTRQEFAQKHPGVSQEVVKLRRDKNLCTRCGKANHRWRECTAPPNVNKFVATATSKKRKSTTDGDSTADKPTAKKTKVASAVRSTASNVPLYAEESDVEMDF